jgi:hypothetical protein
MYTIKTKIEEVVKEFDFVSDWVDTICKMILKKEKESCKITTFYDYGYFVPKGSGLRIDQYEMIYDDRLNHELSKVRVDVTIKIDDFVFTNRLKKGLIPDLIKSMVTEITKYKMQVEYEFHQNIEIKNSIPDFDDSIISIEIIKQEVDQEKIEDEYFDIDDILDKIAKKGIDSLSVAEKSYLDKKSKEM